MPKFIVTAKNNLGATIKKTIDSFDRNSAISLVQSQGMFVVSVRSVEETVNKQPRKAKPVLRKFSHYGVRLDDTISFAQQLATMVESGVPLLRSLIVISGQVDSSEMARILEEVRANVESGQTFSSSLAKHPKVFGPFWISLVEVGEASGTMPKILKSLTDHLKEVAAFRAQVIGAMIYPLILTFVCVVAVLFFALVIGPTFEKIFKDMNATLPPFTVAMLAIFNFIKINIITLFLVAGIGIFALMKYIETAPGRWAWERFLFSLPVAGPMFRLIVVERFAAQLSLLVESGVPILNSLDILTRAVDNSICAAVVRSVREDVKEGKLLADPMEKSQFFPSMAVQMVRVGEETGELAKMLNHVAVYYKDCVRDFVKRFSTLIEPVMLVVMGALVGSIVIAMFMPILTLSTAGK